MLEIASNVYKQLTLRESDVSTGIGVIWNFSTLQNYIEKETVPKEAVPYLAALALFEVEEASVNRFDKTDFGRLQKDLVRMLYRSYYDDTERSFSVEIVDGYFKFYEDDKYIDSMTTLRFERDMEDESYGNKTSSEEEIMQITAKSSINFVIGAKDLTKKEMDDLSGQMISVYKD